MYLLLDVTAPKDAKPGAQFALKANATWLVCEKICVPEEGTFTLDIPVAAASVVDTDAERRFAAAQEALPKPASFKAMLASEGDNLALMLPGIRNPPPTCAFFRCPTR